jgi:hypothetical protein
MMTVSVGVMETMIVQTVVKMNRAVSPVNVQIANLLVQVDSVFRLVKDVMVTRTVWMELMNWIAIQKNATKVCQMSYYTVIGKLYLILFCLII